MSAFEILFHDRYNYPGRAVRFYAEFVGIHPSMMPTVERYNYFFDWKAINQKHNKFLKKLNYCHSVRNKSKIKLSELDSNRPKYQQEMHRWVSIQDKYLSYLVAFWQNYIIPLEEF